MQAEMSCSYRLNLVLIWTQSSVRKNIKFSRTNFDSSNTNAFFFGKNGVHHNKHLKGDCKSTQQLEYLLSFSVRGHLTWLTSPYLKAPFGCSRMGHSAPRSFPR
jgi:hypothetical protein